MAIYMHAVRDGYAVDDGQNQSTLVPILTPFGEQRVVIDINGLSASATNPLPVTLEGSSITVGKVDIQDTNGAAITVGQKVMATSLPVTIASDQSNIPVSQATASALNAQVVGTAAAGAAASGNPVQVGGVYNSSAPTASTGQMEPLQLDVNGNLKDVEQYAPVAEDNTNGVIFNQTKALATNTGAWSLSSSASGGVGTAGVSIKGSAGRVRAIYVSNANATTGFWLQLFNKATAAVNNDVPVCRIFVGSQTIAGQGADASQVLDFGPEGLYLGTGISIAASSTIGLLTLIGATDMHYTIKWL